MAGEPVACSPPRLWVSSFLSVRALLSNILQELGFGERIGRRKILMVTGTAEVGVLWDLWVSRRHGVRLNHVARDCLYGVGHLLMPVELSHVAPGSDA